MNHQNQYIRSDLVLLRIIDSPEISKVSQYCQCYSIRIVALDIFAASISGKFDRKVFYIKNKTSKSQAYLQHTYIVSRLIST